MFIQILLIISMVFFISGCDSGDKGKVTKSSKIPDRREFPVNSDINPCDNFYEYACSRVADGFRLRDDRSSHTFAFNDSHERLLDFKKKYFAKLASKNPESEMEEGLKKYYIGCMNKKGKAKEERELVKKTKEELKKIGTKEEFQDFIAKNILDSSKLSFITFNAGIPNLDRPRYNDIVFDVRLMSLPERGYYHDKDLTNDFKKMIKDFFVTIGEKDPHKKAKLIFDFEKGIADVYPLPEELRDRIALRTSIKREDLVDKYPNLKLNYFLSKIPRHVAVRDVIKAGSFKLINDKLKNYSLDELKTIYLYFYLSDLLDDGYPEYFRKKFEFNRKYLGGPNKRSERQERCTRAMMNSFEKEVDYLLLPKLFPDFPKEKFVSSIEKVRGALIKQLKGNDWLSDSAKKEAIRKIEQAKFSLVTPDKEEDWDFNPRASYFVDSPIENRFRLSQLLLNKSLNELHGPVNINRWQMGPLTVNAYYSPSYNQVVFPIGILQPPFYDKDAPEEVNLGAIGAVIGHELGHAIDNHGNNFDADGKLRSWMGKEDKRKFDDRVNPLISQFEKIGHNGRLTLGENIGDMVGLKTAYYSAFPEGENVDVDLKRRFFLQFARCWCTVEREGYTRMRLKLDPHSLNHARTNEQMKLQKGFAEAYGCKVGDPMVVSDKEIRVW